MAPETTFDRAGEYRRMTVDSSTFGIQLALVPAASALLLMTVSYTVHVGLWWTWLLGTMVCAAGLGLIAIVARHVGDNRVQRVGYVFLAKLWLVLWLLYVGWIPQLEASRNTFGYDPQRFYFQA